MYHTAENQRARELVLLEELSTHHDKLLDDFTLPTFPSRRLRNEISFFEAAFLRLLERYRGVQDEQRTEYQDTESDFQERLRTLFDFLENTSVNHKIQDGENLDHKRLHSASAWPQLSGLISFVVRNRGPFRIAKNTPDSLFYIADEDQVKQGRLLLSDLDLLLPQQPSLSSQRAPDGTVKEALRSLLSLEARCRATINKVLNILENDFPLCGEESSPGRGPSRPHGVMMRLLEIAHDRPLLAERYEMLIRCGKMKEDEWNCVECQDHGYVSFHLLPTYPTHLGRYSIGSYLKLRAVTLPR